MNNIICNYDLELFHPKTKVLKKIQSILIEKEFISSFNPISKQENSFYFKTSASVSCEESGTYLFTDLIQRLLSENNYLDIGGSFIDNIGRGYINSLGHKDYTKLY